MAGSHELPALRPFCPPVCADACFTKNRAGTESKALALLRPPTSLHLVALDALARLPEDADVAQAALRLLDAFSNMGTTTGCATDGRPPQTDTRRLRKSLACTRLVESTAAVLATCSPEPAHVVAMRALKAFGDDGDVCCAALALMKRLLDFGPGSLALGGS